MSTILKSFVLCVAVFSTFFATTTKAMAPIEVKQPCGERSYDEMVVCAATQFNQSPELISKITWCESHHKVKSHDNGRGFNVTGIHNKTFDGWLPMYEKEVGETLNKDSTYDQLKLMSWAFSKGPEYRNQWSTYVAYTKGGTYSFYSRLLKAHFTVYCK